MHIGKTVLRLKSFFFKYTIQQILSTWNGGCGLLKGSRGCSIVDVICFLTMYLFLTALSAIFTLEIYPSHVHVFYFNNLSTVL